MPEGLDAKPAKAAAKTKSRMPSVSMPGAGLPDMSAVIAAQSISLPLYGRIAAGTPIEALRDPSNHIDVPTGMLASNRGKFDAAEHYALEVSGDSMIEAGIMDGDRVIIRKCDHAENGAIVVALVDDSEATLKYLEKRGGQVALIPANKNYETRTFGPDHVKVQGRLVGLVRRY
jgi:repressor LexA